MDGRGEGMDMGLAVLGRMAERGRGEGRGEGRGDDEAGMAGGEAVRLRRTASLGRLLKMRDESLREEILGLCWMGGQMSCAEQCNMGSRGRGTRRTSRSDEAGCESEGADVHAPSGSEKKRRRKQKEKRKKNREQNRNQPTVHDEGDTRADTATQNTPHATLPFRDTGLSLAYGVDPNARGPDGSCTPQARPLI